LINFIVLRP